MDVRVYRCLSSRDSDPYWNRKLKQLRLQTLEISANKFVQPSTSANAVWLDIEKEESRYLISGFSDGSVEIFDLDSMGNCRSVANVSSSSRSCHQHGVLCVSWYPVDSGMFLTSGGDNLLKVWDTNRLSVAVEFPFKDDLKQHSMSPAPCCSHSLVSATGCSLIYLADLRTSWSAQTLRGHQGNVRSVQFSSADPFLLVSGSSDGQILMWDIRNGKTFLKSLSSDEKSLKAVSAHSSAVVSLRFSPDGNYLVSYGADGKLLIWDSVKGILRRGNSNSLISSHYALRKNVQMDIAYDVDGVDFVCVPVEKCVKLISLQTGEVMNNLNAKDRRLFVWTPRMDQTWGRPDDFDPSNARKFDEDNWGDL